MNGEITIKNNEDDTQEDITTTTDGTFSLGVVPYNDPYHVVIVDQPTGQSCAVVNGASTMGIAGASITINCFDGKTFFS